MKLHIGEVFLENPNTCQSFCGLDFNYPNQEILPVNYTEGTNCKDCLESFIKQDGFEDYSKNLKKTLNELLIELQN